MWRASRKCCTLALWLWAASPRGKSDCIIRCGYAACTCGGWGQDSGPCSWVLLSHAPVWKAPLSLHTFGAKPHNSCLSFIHTCQHVSPSPLNRGRGWTGLGISSFPDQSQEQPQGGPAPRTIASLFGPFGGGKVPLWSAPRPWYRVHSSSPFLFRVQAASPVAQADE